MDMIEVSKYLNKSGNIDNIKLFDVSANQRIRNNG